MAQGSPGEPRIPQKPPMEGGLRETLYTVIFGTETPAGKHFDMVLIYAILISVLAVMLDSVGGFAENYHFELLVVEWFFTILFTIEYGLRIYCSPHPWRYVRSFYGIVDLFSILPSYLGFFVVDANNLLVIRLLRILRIFRILKLIHYLREANVLLRAMLMSRRKILVFFCSVLVLSVIFGSMMFIVEGPEHGFTSIPKSIYWTIVTITTVGYGDITPQSTLGQIVAAMVMLTGYSIIAVPTGILTAELTQEIQRDRLGRQCKACQRGGHDLDAWHCKFCGAKLYG